MYVCVYIYVHLHNTSVYTNLIYVHAISIDSMLTDISPPLTDRGPGQLQEG